MEKMLSLLYKFTGGVYIPPYIKEIDERIILHISDTPVCFFSPLTLLIKRLKPHYIIHTGDMVDNLKLQFSHSLLPRYERNLKAVMNIMESSSAETIYITPGNHDRIELMENFSKKSTIIDNPTNLNIEGIPIRISHYAEDILEDPQDFNLYGHDLSLHSSESGGKVFLNGITSINIISIESRKVFKLLYPFGTDDMRLNRTKIGL